MERSVKVRLELAIAGYQQAAARAAASTKAIGTEVEQTARKSRQEMQTIGTAATVMGGAIVGALALAGRSAIQFESSFAGVRKTVNATEAEFGRLASGMRDMARSIPTNVNDLNAIGEAAGQLGIQTQNLLGFTRTMADLGETTNLSADEAATSLARLANITQMPQTEFDRLGSTIVALGNNFATTEAEIVEMGQRIAGAGAQIGMTEAEILSISAALSSLGINAEAGGTAISKVMIDIASHVANNTSDLAMFAQVAGMSAEQFSQAWGQDASAALGAFVSGLGSMEERGGSTLQVLEQLGITEVRMRDALLRASGAGELWADAGEVANRAWEENVALTEEAAQRYGTVESRIQMARNAINDAGITLGQTFAPAIGVAADAVAGLAGGIADLPGPVAGVAAGVGALGGAASLAAGGFLLAAPRIVETKEALSTLSTQMPKTVGALRGLGSFVTGPWGAAIGGGIALLTLWGREQQEVAEGAERLRAAIDQTAGSVNEGTAAWIEQELRGRDVLRFLDDFGVSLEDVQAAVTGTEEEARALMEAFGAKEGTPLDSLAHVLPGLRDHTADLTNSLRILRDQWQVTGDNMIAAEEGFLGVTSALAAGATAFDYYTREGLRRATGASQEATGATGALGEGLEGAGAAAAEAADPIKEFEDAIRSVLGIFLSVAEAEIAWEQALDDLTQTVKDNGTSLDRNTEKGRENERALMDGVQAALDHGQALVEQGASAEGAASAVADHIDQLRQEAIDAGLSKDKVDELLDSYGATPEEIFTRIIAQTADAEAALDRLAAKKAALTGTGYVRVGTDIVPHGVNRHSGGRAGDGPPHSGALKPNELVAVLEDDEFVVRGSQATKHRGLLEAINSGALPTFHGGGSVSATASLSAGSGTAALQAAITSLDHTLQEMDRTEEARSQDRRRGDLVQGVHSAQRAFDTATDPEEQAAAWERLVDAYDQLAEFDRARVVAAERAEIAAAQERLAAELRIAANREEFEFARMSTSEQIRLLTRQLQAETRFTDEWMALHNQRAQILDQQQQEMAAAVDVLNRQLDERARLLDRQEQAEQAHQDNVADIWARANDEIGRLVRDRADQLRVEMGHDGFHHRAGALAGQLAQQTAALKAWANELDALRGRGVSDMVVSMLGLDEGPAALGQIRELAASSDQELAQLNREAREREAAISEQVASERRDRDTQLGRDIVDIRRQAHAEVAEATREHNEEMRALGQELAAIGRDTSRSYTEAITEGLKSGIPGIRKQVREVQKLMRELKTAQAAMSDVGGGTMRQMLQAPQVRDAVVSAGHDPRSVVDMADIAAALKKIGHNYGSSIDRADIEKLLASQGQSIIFNAPRDASFRQLSEDFAWLLRTGS